MKIYIILILFVGLLAVSCNKDNEAALYQPEKTIVSFLSDRVVGMEIAANNNYTIDCKIIRTNDEGDLTVPVKLEITDDIDGLFELASSNVTFKAGETIQ